MPRRDPSLARLPSRLCDGLGQGDVIEQTVTAGSSSLYYDAAADQYTTVWKTSRATTFDFRQ